MLRLCCTAQNVALRLFAKMALVCLVASCGTVELFGEYDLPESAEAQSQPYPRLVDVPPAPPVGTYSEGVPDPAQGVQAQTELSAAAVSAEAQARAMADPVFDPFERAALLEETERK